jgi:hypothetical protein
VEPVHAIEDIKRVTFMDLGNKRRQMRYETKKKLELTSDDNVRSVVIGRGKKRLFSMQKISKYKLIGGCLRMIRFFLTNAKL